MISDSVYGTIDSKLEEIRLSGKISSVIIINADIYRTLQQEMVESDLAQGYGKIRSPHDLRSYKGLQILTSHVVPEVEVF